MNKSPRGLDYTRLPLAAAALAFWAAVSLGGCIVQERVAAPPPRPYEVPQPPPSRDYAPTAEYQAPQDSASAYSEPGVDVEVQANEPPPPLPDYEQPPCPEDGYLWTPGYWAWGGGGYYWVPGTWVQPPRVGVLWTPAYWGFFGGAYVFHAGYWGPHVGFYGGVNYGYGYTGVGFVGGRWNGNRYAYNRTVNNVNVTNIHNTYNETVINNVTVNKVSYNGGAGGIAAAPTAQQRSAAHESHVAPTPMQRRHIQESGKNPVLDARANGGHPAIAATPTPAAFNAPGVVRARGANAPGAGGQAPAAARFNNGNGGPPPGAGGQAPAAARFNNGNGGPPPGAGGQAPAAARFNNGNGGPPPRAGGQAPAAARFNNGNGGPPPGAGGQAPAAARFNNGNGRPPPGAQPNVNHAPPNPGIRPQSVGRPAAVPPPPKPQRPKPQDGKQHDRDNR